jgi:thiol:disulfide interchange protein
MILTTLSFIFISNTASAAIQWNPYSQTIFKDAADQNKIVLIYAMADACKACKEMQNKTFSNKQVDKLINDSFYPVIVHADVDKTTAQKYLITNVPVVLMFDTNGTLTKMHEGFENAAYLTKQLTDMIAIKE